MTLELLRSLEHRIGDRRSRLEQQLSQAREYGYLGPGPVDRHFRHALGFGVVVASQCILDGDHPAIDLGSGGGVPGLVLACIWPDVPWTLLDSMERRTAFLREAVDSLGLANSVTVWRVRAEDAGRSARRSSFSLATARGFSGASVTAECAAPLLAPDGRLVVSEPPDSDGRRWSSEGLRELGLVRDGLARTPTVESTDEELADVFGYQILRQTHRCPPQFPRKPGQIAKRPLW